MFGGEVTQAIDPQWHSHAAIPKTVIDLLGLPALGVPRLESSPSLATHVDPSLTRHEPTPPGSTITRPAAPNPPPRPQPPAPWPEPLNQPMPALVTLDGSSVPAPTDGLARPKPPKPPKNP